MEKERRIAMIAPVWAGSSEAACRLARRPRHTSIRLVTTLGALLVAAPLASCAPAGTTTPRATTTPARVVITPTSTGPTSVLGTPSPAAAALAAPPTNCAFVDPPQTVTVAQLGPNANAHLVGGGYFWIFGVYYQREIHLGQAGSPPWPIDKMVVEVGPSYTQPVTLKLRNLATGALAWWTDGSGPPGAATQTLILDPQTDTESVGQLPGVPDVPHGQVSSDWHEWGIFPLFTVAGCYSLKASWSGGSWRSVFAVGI